MYTFPWRGNKNMMYISPGRELNIRIKLSNCCTISFKKEMKI
jgi:hypothetical protein